MGLRNTRKSIAELQRSAEHSLNKTAIKQNYRSGHKTSLMTRQLYGVLHWGKNSCLKICPHDGSNKFF